MKQKKTLADRAFDGAAVMLVANITKQGIGLVSMFVLARLLSPDDYGIVAIVTLVVHFFDVFAQIGIKQYVLSREKLKITELHTAWTLQLVVRAGLAMAVVLAAPLTARFFDRPELTAVLMVAAVIPILTSLQAPGVLLLQRDFNYRFMSLISVVAKVLSASVGVCLAWWMRSYWALIVADVVFAVVVTGLSYRAHPLRPRLQLTGWQVQWSFSKWMLLRAVLGFTRSKIDNLLIGKFLGVSELGVYNFSKHLATMPQESLGSPLSDIFTRGIGGARGDISATADVVTRILSAQFALLTPIVVGTILLAEILVGVLLGPAWQQAIAVIEALAPLSLTFAMATTMAVTLVAVDRVRLAFWVDVFSCTSTILMLTVAIVIGLKVSELAFYRTLLSAVFAAVFYGAVSAVLPLQHGRLLMSLLPAALSSALMCLVLAGCKSLLDGRAAPIVILASLALLGGITYTFTFAILLSRPNTPSPEIRFLRETLQRLTARLLNR